MSTILRGHLKSICMMSCVSAETCTPCIASQVIHFLGFGQVSDPGGGYGSRRIGCSLLRSADRMEFLVLSLSLVIDGRARENSVESFDKFR